MISIQPNLDGLFNGESEKYETSHLILASLKEKNTQFIA